MYSPATAPFLTPGIGGGGSRPTEPEPETSSPPPPPPPPADPLPGQSDGQASSADPVRPSDSGSDRSKNKRKRQEPASSQSSESEIPQDIAWLPEYEASGLVTFMQATARGTRDSSEDKTTAVCDALYTADPEGVARGLKFITGCEPDDEEQDTLQELINVLKAIAPRGLFEDEPWYTTQLGPSKSLAESSAEEAALTASQTAQVDSTVDQSQAHAGAGGSEQAEINLLLQWGLSEAFPGEWDQQWTTREELQDFLVSDLKQEIQGYDETARVVPGFGGTVINWDDLSIEEMMALYRVDYSVELAARGEHYEGFPPGYDEIKASLDRATELESLAGPIPLDDSEACAAAFGIADAKVQRKHVQDQLAVIYEHLGIEMPENHLENRSTTELKYELYYRLNYDVPRFWNDDENEKENRIGNFVIAYQKEARFTVDDVIDRLQGTYHQPDVLGFLFIMGLSIAFEPVDYVLTAVDVIQALSEGDTESAVGNFLLGAAPGLNSKMDDILLPFLGRFDNIRLLPAYSGWNTRQTEALTQGRIVAPGSKSGLHQELDAIDSRPPDERFNVNWADPKSAENTISGRAENDIGKQFERRGYNVVIKPTRTQLDHPKIGYKGAGTPDYIIEGEVFDAYSPNRHNPRNIASRVQRKLESGQADRIIVDITESTVTEGELAKQFKKHGDGMLYNLDKGTDLRELWIRKNDQLFPFLTIENNNIRMLWP